MKHIILILATLFVFTTASAQYEAADAVFEKLIREYTVENDGSTSFREYKQLKLLTHQSFNRYYGETFIVYNPDFQKLKINDAYTIMANGRKIVTPENAFNEVLPRSASRSATANHLREMVVTHTATELGATIYLDYTIITSKDFLPGLMESIIIQESSPVENMEIIVKVPADMELSHRMTGLRTAPEILLVGNQKVYSWKFSGLPASPKESFRGKTLPAAPRLTFSTAGNTEALIKWITRQSAFDFKLNEQMKSFVEKIKNPSDEIKTLLDIQKAVAIDMYTEQYDPILTGFSTRNPSEIMASNGGNKLEKSVLLAALLKEAGFNAFPVFVFPESLFDPDAGNLKIIDDMLVMAETKGFGAIYLSVVSTSPQCLSYSHPEDIFVPLDKNSGYEPINQNNTKNTINLSAKITLDGDLKPSGQINLELAGIANAFLSLQEDKGSIKSQLSGSLIKAGEDITVVNSNVAKSEITIKITGDKAAEEHLGYYRWMLPVIKSGFDRLHINYLESERIDPFVIPCPLSEKYTFSIEIPEGYIFANPQYNNRIKSSAGSVSIEIKPKNNQLLITREISISKTTVSPADYETFREMINLWLDKNLQTVVFRAAE